MISMKSTQGDLDHPRRKLQIGYQPMFARGHTFMKPQEAVMAFGRWQPKEEKKPHGGNNPRSGDDASKGGKKNVGRDLEGATYDK